MSLVREPLQGLEGEARSLGTGTLAATLYWLAALLAAARAYDVGFHRYAADLSGADPLALTVARDAGLWAATATVAAAFILFLALLALIHAGSRLLRDGRRGGA